MATQPSKEKYAHIQPEPSISREDYMKNRVVYKITRYTAKSEQQRLWYQWTSVIAIISAAIVPVLINLGVRDIVPTMLSLLVTILISLEKLFHFREHWRNYDSISAALRSEQVQFQTRSGVYKEKAAKQDAFRLFVKRFEEIIKEERNETIEMRTKENV